MIVWITGASSGLGREVALQYARAGHTVCVSARAENELRALEKSASAGKILAFPLDISAPEKVTECAQRINEQVGLPDLCIFNAGTHKPNSAVGLNTADFRRLMDINFLGTVNCLQAVLPAYLQAGRGSIAVVSSVAGYRGLPNASAYGATKAALINMCESLEPELAARNVRLQLVNPGFVRTPLTDKNDFDMPFLMEVEDAAASMIKGIASGRFEITFPKRFTWQLKLMRILPIALYLRLTSKLLRKEPDHE